MTLRCQIAASSFGQKDSSQWKWGFITCFGAIIGQQKTHPVTVVPAKEGIHQTRLVLMLAPKYDSQEKPRGEIYWLVENNQWLEKTELWRLYPVFQRDGEYDN